MASKMPNNPQSSTSFYEFEGLEVTEFDEDTLRELLEEEGEPEQEVQESGIEDPHSVTMEDSGKIEPRRNDFAWIDTMETDPALPSSDVDFWYIDTHTEEIIGGTTELVDVIDDSQIYNAVQTDEVTHYGLWQDD